jgi:hypothetical protein
MSIPREAETPGDGNPQTNARGRVYTTETSADGEEIEVAGLKDASFGAWMIFTVCMVPFGGDVEPKPDIRPVVEQTVTVTQKPRKCK